MGKMDGCRAASMYSTYILTLSLKTAIVVPLMVAGTLIIIMFPVAAARGALHIPAYVAIAGLAFGVSLLFGRISGIRGIAGTSSGTTLSVGFFLVMAVAIGAILALFFYQPPPEI
jgi:hypothetical protein